MMSRIFEWISWGGDLKPDDAVKVEKLRKDIGEYMSTRFPQPRLEPESGEDVESETEAESNESEEELEGAGAPLSWLPDI